MVALNALGLFTFFWGLERDVWVKACVGSIYFCTSLGSGEGNKGPGGWG